MGTELFDEANNIKSFSHPIWNRLSSNLEGKISANSLYISVYQDRHSWQTRLRQKVLKPHVTEVNSNVDYASGCNDSETDDETDGTSDDNNQFKFDIPFKDFLKMTPTSITYGKKHSKKTYTVLKQGLWTNIINDWFIKCSKNMCCCIMYKRCRVANNPSRAKNYLTFSGKCHDCGAVATGWAVDKPVEGMPLTVNIILSGVKMSIKHHSKRPLNGAERTKVGLDLIKDCASNWRRNATKSFEFGDKIPVNLYGKNVLRKCKQEKKDDLLHIAAKCPIKSLVNLKYSVYAGSIHLICADPFIVYYWTPCQLVVYKQLKKSYVRLAIDATGGIVKKIKRTQEGLLSSHIFLYEAVVTTNDYQCSITQMLSEKQDTFTIFSWLTQWLNEGVSAPEETVTDFSMALLGAISRAFCGGITLRDYVETCLEMLNGCTLPRYQVKCYIRIDIAHLIKLVCRWKCWSGQDTKHVKEFFVRFVQNFDLHFAHIFKGIGYRQYFISKYTQLVPIILIYLL